jgi:hypothetical protein
LTVFFSKLPPFIKVEKQNIFKFSQIISTTFIFPFAFAKAKEQSNIN